ncbi:patatin-like phospholipase family protein [Massilia sp. R2A-15]|uniref:patatin-like phospholipase family protein n=1 Tax=Massilia sp. R2A-15 TaxID=3064278 RepID=UPI00273518DF|nr:patatin-like phospholipase family protein [Massilia sp. R2A-15]WLI90286.1 patatin-like phospholipase family protein [Massilia sp. R2A-15]
MSSFADTRKIVIACQGGGSHAAYAAGALKRWLPLIEKSRGDLHPMKLVGISGTSGGGLCALLAWYGLLQGGADQACRKLEAFWHANCAQTPGETLWNAATIAATSALPFDLSFSPYVPPLRDGVDLLTSTWPQLADTLGPFNTWGRGDYFQLDRLIAQQVDFDLVAALGALLGVSRDIARWREADIQSRMKPPLAPADNEKLKRQLAERIHRTVEEQPAALRRLMGPAGFREGCPLDVALSRWSGQVAADPTSFDILDAAGMDLMAQIPHLLMGAVDIEDGEFVAFSSERAATDGGISLQAVLASAALPWMFKAVEVPFIGPDGARSKRSFWDGLFSQNPPIKNFLAGVEAERMPAELWVLQINPRDFDVDQLKFDIGDRRNELSGNLSLNQEISFIEAVNKRITRGDDHKHQPVQVHRVILDRCAIEKSAPVKLNALSKSDRSPILKDALMAHGEMQAQRFFRMRDALRLASGPLDGQSRADSADAFAVLRNVKDQSGDSELHLNFDQTILPTSAIADNSTLRATARWHARGILDDGAGVQLEGAIDFLIDDRSDPIDVLEMRITEVKMEKGGPARASLPARPPRGVRPPPKGRRM